MTVRVQSEPFDFGEVAEGFSAGQLDTGAIVTFTGLVRDLATADLVAMQIEHYPGMTEKALEEIVDQAMRRWDLKDALVIHRFGRLAPGERIMMVATAARHRDNAFEAAAFLMDFLKSRAPFWKKELRHDSGDWVEAKTSDEAALTRW